MKLVTTVITFILTAQLVYANATVCENFGVCGQKVESEQSTMKDCPHHSNQKSEDKKDKDQPEIQCKCCAVLTLEASFESRPNFESVLSFIEFQYQESAFAAPSSVFLRPPIS